MRAEWLRRAGAHLDAERAADRAASLAPGHGGVALTRAALALDRGRPADARVALAAWLARADAPAEAHWLASRVALAERDTLAALAAMDAALGSPGDAAARAHAPDRVLERARLARAAGLDRRALEGLLDAASRTPSPAVSEEAWALVRTLGVHAAAPTPTPYAHGESDARRGEGVAGVQAVLRRGPYLQRVTWEAVVVRWRTDVPTDSRVRLARVPLVWEAEWSDTALVTEHEVEIKGLDPATRWWYAIGSSDGDLLADSSTTFRTAPVPGDVAPVRAWIVGDSGSNNAGSRAVRDAFARWTGARGADLWLLLGDNAYGTGTDAEYQSGLFDLYRDALRCWPAWPTRGNHDVLYAGLANDYYDHFALPTRGEGGGVESGTEAYYAFDWGPVHFVCLDSEGSDRSPGGAMVRWLRQDLAAATSPWIVAYWHHPPYTKGSHDSDNLADSGGRMRDMREFVLPVLDSAGVDLVLTGHSHAYERSRLIAGHYGLSSTFGPPMIVAGGDGAPDGDGAYPKPVDRAVRDGIVHAVNGSAAQISGGSLDHPVMVRSLNVMGSMVLDVMADRLEGRFLDSLGVVRDSFAIVKRPPVTGKPSRALALALATPRPSPFARTTSVEWVLPHAGDVRLDVFDAAGRVVASLARGRWSAGRHAVTWDGRDAAGRETAPGLYFVQLRHGGAQRVRRVVRVP